MTAIAVYRDRFIGTGESDKLRDHKISALLGAIGVEEPEDGLIQSVLFLKGPAIGLSHIFNNGIG